MVAGIRFKICGLKTLIDAEVADRCGADYLGFNLYPPSPRFLPLGQYQAMAERLPGRKHVAVSVEPSLDELAAMDAAGFDFFQIHFRASIDDEVVAGWSDAVGRDRLWLAPKLPPGVDVSAEWLGLADYCMLDTFHADVFGGSGEVGDWAKFVRHQETYPEKRWILAGGLTPENVAEAVRSTGARFVDVASGVEASPGVKDAQKLKRFAAALQSARS